MVQLLELSVVQDALLTAFAVIALTGLIAFLFSKYGAEEKETERQRKRRLAREDRERREADVEERRKANNAEKERQRQERRKKKLIKKTAAGASSGSGKEKASHASALFRTGIKGHTARIVHFAVPNDAAFVTTASEDGTVRITCEWCSMTAPCAAGWRPPFLSLSLSLAQLRLLRKHSQSRRSHEKVACRQAFQRPTSRVSSRESAWRRRSPHCSRVLAG